MKQVAIVSGSSVLTDAEIAAMVPDLQTQVSRDFAPVWGIDAQLLFVPKGQAPPQEAWWIAVVDDTDTADALGWHDLTPAELPFGKVFAKTTMQAGDKVSVCLSHELLEMLADPWINACAYVQAGRVQKFYAQEVSDPCERDDQGYKINSTVVSDFVFPAYWNPAVKGQRLDFMGHIKKPLQVLPGGYASIWTGGKWTQVQADHAMRLGRYAGPPVGSRRERRARGHRQWRPSAPVLG